MKISEYMEYARERRRAKAQISKDMREKYRDALSEQMERNRFLSSNSDFSFLEKLIQKVNSNPSLKVEVVLKDGTLIRLRSYVEEPKRDYEMIDGRDAQ